MDYLFILSVIFVFIFFITTAILYIVRPYFILVETDNNGIVIEPDMWYVFIVSLCVGLIVVLFFTAIYAKGWIR